MGMKLHEETLTFERERIRFDNSNVAILNCRRANGSSLLDSLNGVSVKAECEPDELVPGLDYRFYGHWTRHSKYGDQFIAKTFVRTQPHGRAGTIKYLMQAPNIGRGIAGLLWEKFGGDAVRIVREQPDVASAAAGGGFTPERAAEASAFLAREQAIEATTIDLMELLDGRGFPRSTGKRAVKEWGNRAAQLVRQNPYLLMRFRGCGFLRCDQLYLDLGGNPARMKRQALCAWYAIARDTNGDTWFQPAAIERGLRERISGASVDAVSALKLAKRSGLLATRRDSDGRLWIADGGKAKSEQVVADRVSAWLQEPSEWPTIDSLDVSEHQRDRLQQALAAPISVFTGGPGTGKTYSAARVIAKLIEKHGDGQVAVAAPTGKAAVRISEAMAGYGVQVRAKTIHSLLGVESHSEGDGWGFAHDENKPLPCKFLVVDESSMIDTSLAASLFRACAKGTHLLLVGDIGQLPPVGHGAPLRDLIAAGVPTGELTEVRRNSGQIVQACHEIRQGKQFTTCGELRPNDEWPQNLKVLPAVGPKAAADKIVKTIRSIASRGLANPIWGCQVIVAVNDKSELSRRKLNMLLQGELNPGGERAASNPFRCGDKIVCLKNGFYPVLEDAPPEFNAEENDGKVFIANGEQAAVKHVEPKLTIAQLDSPPRLVKIPRGGGGDDANSESSGAGCDWDLAYAISCHKSQGSEWPVVFVVLDEYPGARMVCSREWLYTALSRAKLVCFPVGKIATAYGMIQREAIRMRKTFLQELICDESAATDHRRGPQNQGEAAEDAAGPEAQSAR